MADLKDTVSKRLVVIQRETSEASEARVQLAAAARQQLHQEAQSDAEQEQQSTQSAPDEASTLSGVEQAEGLASGDSASQKEGMHSAEVRQHLTIVTYLREAKILSDEESLSLFDLVLQVPFLRVCAH